MRHARYMVSLPKSAVLNALARLRVDATVYDAIGLWKGERESSVVVEVYGDTEALDRAATAIGQTLRAHDQKCALLEERKATVTFPGPDALGADVDWADGPPDETAMQCSACAACEWQGPYGRLGSRDHYRCRYCGAEWSREREQKRSRVNECPDCKSFSPCWRCRCEEREES